MKVRHKMRKYRYCHDPCGKLFTVRRNVTLALSRLCCHDQGSGHFVFFSREYPTLTCVNLFTSTSNRSSADRSDHDLDLSRQIHILPVLRDLYDLSDLYDLYDLAHVAGCGTRITRSIYVAHVSWFWVCTMKILHKPLTRAG